jgi:hypothetical protein
MGSGCRKFVPEVLGALGGASFPHHARPDVARYGWTRAGTAGGLRALSTTPLRIVTEPSTVEDHIQGLKLGANDHLSDYSVIPCRLRKPRS